MITIDPKYFRKDGVLSPRAPSPIKLAYFINRCNTKHNFKFDYTKTDWVNAKTPVTIICPVHGEFTQLPQDHYSSKTGCPKCGAEKLKHHPNKITQEAFIDECSKQHIGFYTYENTVFDGVLKPVIVTCPVHGDFSIHARSHLNGKGFCPKCYHRNTGFYSEGYFSNHPEKKEIPGKLYFVRLYNDTESFYKVGITKHGAYHRFYVDDKIPYNVDIIKETDMLLYDAYQKEQMLLEKYKNNYVVPLINFAGKTECLNIDIRTEI